MTRNKAIKIAIECIQLQMRRYIFDANTATILQSGEDMTPIQSTAVKKVREFRDAIMELEAIANQPKMF